MKGQCSYNMKRLTCILTIICLMALTACAAPAEQEGLSIVATIFPPYDFARAVAGERAQVSMLLPPGSEAHSFEPTPKDIIAIQQADIFIYTGGESESWVTDMLGSLEDGPEVVISMLEVADPLREETVEGMQAEQEHEHEHEHEHDHEDTSGYDEHVWTSPLNAIVISEAIADALCGLDPDNAGEYRASLGAYSGELARLDGLFRQAVAEGKRNTLVFGDRFPMRYFTEEYGLEYYAAFPGCSAETEASAATLAFLIDKVKAEGIPVVFSMELSNGRIAAAISEATGARALTLTSCHNLSREELEAGVTYIDMMEGNLSCLKEALG